MSGSISGVRITFVAVGVVVIGLVSLSFAARAVEKPLGNDEPMNLVRPLVDLRALRIPHEALHRIVPRVSRAAIDLNGIGRDTHGDVRGVPLGHARWRVDGLSGVAHASRAPGE